MPENYSHNVTCNVEYPEVLVSEKINEKSYSLKLRSLR